MRCTEPDDQPLTCLWAEIVSAEGMQLDVVASQFFARALQVDVDACHGADMHPVVGRYCFQRPAEILVEHLHEQLPALLIFAAHLAHVPRKMPVSDEGGGAELNRYRTMP